MRRCHGRQASAHLARERAGMMHSEKLPDDASRPGWRPTAEWLAIRSRARHSLGSAGRADQVSWWRRCAMVYLAGLLIVGASVTVGLSVASLDHLHTEMI